MQFVKQYEAVVAARWLAGVKANYDRKVISNTATSHIVLHCLHMRMLCTQGTRLRSRETNAPCLELHCIRGEMRLWHVRFYTA